MTTLSETLELLEKQEAVTKSAISGLSDILDIVLSSPRTEEMRKIHVRITKALREIEDATKDEDGEPYEQCKTTDLRQGEFGC